MIDFHTVVLLCNHILFLCMDFPQRFFFPASKNELSVRCPSVLWETKKDCTICQLNLYRQAFPFTWTLLAEDIQLKFGFADQKKKAINVIFWHICPKIWRYSTQSHMYMRAQRKSLPAALELLASKPSLGDLWLPSSLELVNCLSLFLLSMLQQKPQARSAHLQATENDFCVTPCWRPKRSCRSKKIKFKTKSRQLLSGHNPASPSVGSLQLLALPIQPLLLLVLPFRKTTTAIIFSWHYLRADFTASLSLHQNTVILTHFHFLFLWPHLDPTTSPLWGTGEGKGNKKKKKEKRKGKKMKWFSSFWEAQEH